MEEIVHYRNLWFELKDKLDINLYNSELDDLVHIVHKYSKLVERVPDNSKLISVAEQNQQTKDLNINIENRLTAIEKTLEHALSMKKTPSSHKP